MDKSYIVGASIVAMAVAGFSFFQLNGNDSGAEKVVNIEQKSFDEKEEKTSIPPNSKALTSNVQSQERELTKLTTAANNSVSPLSDMSEIERDISELNIPEDIRGLSLEELESFDEKIKHYFEENEVVERINDDLIDEKDKEHISLLIRKATEIRSMAFDFRLHNLNRELKVVKQQIVDGEIPMPEPLSQEDLQEIEELARLEYEELVRQEEKRRQIEDEELRKEDEMFN